MKKPKATICLLLLFTVIAVSGCKKKSNSNPLAGSVLLYINLTNSNGDITYYRMVYGAGNNIDSIVITGGGTDTGYNDFLAFDYLNSSYIITDKSNNQTTVHLNSNVLIDTIRSATSTAYTYLQYSGTLLGAVNNEEPLSSYPYYTLYTTDYNYSGNNISSITSTGTAETYDYNTSLSGQLGDPQRIGELLTYGRTYTASANLATDMYVNGTWQEKYTYQLDGSGRITLMTRVINNTSGGSNDTLRYAYTYNY